MSETPSKPDEPQAEPEPQQPPQEAPAPDDGDDSGTDEPQVGRRPEFVEAEASEEDS